MHISNQQLAKIFKNVSAALTFKKANLFQIRAYDTAATVIEHLTSEAQDLWEQDQLDQIPGIGENLKAHLDELFKTGKVKHWEDLKKDIPKQSFEFLNIPGVGPQTALKLAELNIKNIVDLEKQLKNGELVKKGLSEKMAQKLLLGLKEKESVNTGRILLPVAFTQAERILDYLKKSKEVKKADVLGSLRRMVATVGDLDFAIASNDPSEVVEYIIQMPGVLEVIEKGEEKLSLILSSGLHADFLIVPTGSYGTLLQHFTGSKSHNIHLRTLAEKKNLSLSEHGVKKVQSVKGKGQSQLIKCSTEDELYSLLGMQTPPPEIREDTGEIEAALRSAQGKLQGLPKLITLEDIKGDLHLHSSFPIEPSHDLGVNDLKVLAEKAKELGYIYLGSADHQPSVGKHTSEQVLSIIKRRSNYIEQINSSSNLPRVLNLLEVDISPDGNLSVPDEALELLDFAIVGVHSVHRMPKKEMTKRILKALEHPKAKVLSHPTGRLLNERDSYDADWDEIFKFAAQNQKAMEINAFPNRLDLPDILVRKAKDKGVKFVINTDAHEVSQMENMRYGVAVARRGWLEKEDVINCWDYTELTKWFKI